MPAHTCVPTAKKVWHTPTVSSSCLLRCIHLLSSNALRSHLHHLPTHDLPGAQALLCHTSAYSIAMCAAPACRPLSASRHAHSRACLRFPVLSAGSYFSVAYGTFALATLHPNACFESLCAPPRLQHILYKYATADTRPGPGAGGMRAVAAAAIPRAGQHCGGLLLAHPHAAGAGPEPAAAPGRRCLLQGPAHCHSACTWAQNAQNRNSRAQMCANAGLKPEACFMALVGMPRVWLRMHAVEMHV